MKKQTFKVISIIGLAFAFKTAIACDLSVDPKISIRSKNSYSMNACAKLVRIESSKEENSGFQFYCEEVQSRSAVLNLLDLTDLDHGVYGWAFKSKAIFVKTKSKSISQVQKEKCDKLTACLAAAKDSNEVSQINTLQVSLSCLQQ